MHVCSYISLQVPSQIQIQLQEACKKMSGESGKALKELASAIKNMTKPSSVDLHIANSKNAVKAFKLLLKPCSGGDVGLLEAMPTAIVAAQLAEVINCVEKIAEAVQQLALLARFKDADPEQRLELGQQQFSDIEGPQHVITINGSPAVFPEASLKKCATVVYVTDTDHVKGSKAKTNVREMRQYLSF